ncbi:hypothetical protein OpiT1DRAFT_00129 [Opitutaceae bacterium TAV1]|nr:hypothetical protein OpiT1DRAFT_00129 [Opitutaceae bacterium TAV1]
MSGDFTRMSARKPAQSEKEVPSQGALLAAKYRARANLLTDEQRQAHRARAMSIIYGSLPPSTDARTVHARRR